MFQDTEVFTVQAIDGDTSVNENVSYSIISREQYLEYEMAKRFFFY